MKLDRVQIKISILEIFIWTRSKLEILKISNFWRRIGSEWRVSTRLRLHFLCRFLMFGFFFFRFSMLLMLFYALYGLHFFFRFFIFFLFRLFYVPILFIAHQAQSSQKAPLRVDRLGLGLGLIHTWGSFWVNWGHLVLAFINS